MSAKFVVAEFSENDSFDSISYSEDFQNNADTKAVDEIVFVEPRKDDEISFSEEDIEERPTLPGAVDYADDIDEEEEKEEEDWETGRNVNKFMVYITDAYPSKIPKHNGSSIVAIESAISFLNRINKEISEAVRKDTKGCLELDKLEDIRKGIYKDIGALKEHIKKLENKLKKSAEEESNLIVKVSDIKKERTTPKIQLVMTPFERAISGMIVNAVVSAGHPIDDVFDYLKEKYSLTEREELSMLQLLMDMGFPIYKDRGALGEEEGGSSGVDFVKNYFA